MSEWALRSSCFLCFDASGGIRTRPPVKSRFLFRTCPGWAVAQVIRSPPQRVIIDAKPSRPGHALMYLLYVSANEFVNVRFGRCVMRPREHSRPLYRILPRRVMASPPPPPRCVCALSCAHFVLMKIYSHRHVILLSWNSCLLLNNEVINL